MSYFLWCFTYSRKNYFFGLIPAFKAIISSPIDTTSAPKPNFFISLNKLKLLLDLTEKQIRGENDLKFLLNLFIFSFKSLYE